jgi:hypothetical protein
MALGCSRESVRRRFKRERAMDPTHYALLEEHFLRLLPSVLPVMEPSERAFAQEYVDAGDYGLALEAVVDNLLREAVQVTDDTYQEIASLSALMPGVVDDQLMSVRALCESAT